MDGDERQVDGGPAGLPPLAVRQALAAVLAGRLPLAAHAVLAGTLGAEQLYALEEGVQQLTDDGHGPEVIAELERRLVGLASARRDVDLAGPAAAYRAGLGGDVGAEEVVPGPAGSGPANGEAPRVDPAEIPSSDVGTVGAGVRPATDRVPPVSVAGIGSPPAPIPGAARPARRAEPRDGAARVSEARRRRPGGGAPRGRGTGPSWGRATARGPPRPDGSACAEPRPVIGCAV
jgi:hypothetical protein